ncbi:MAG: hypothetical protein IT203_01730 [Fimbriimonadaceae bacterium]|nr:hypothetical protein [Fimbriimonadaceae bacterium]
MLKTTFLSKFLFVAIGVFVALAGVRVYAGPPQSNGDIEKLNRNLDRIATSLERLQREGMDMEVKQAFGTKFKVEIAK